MSRGKSMGRVLTLIAWVAAISFIPTAVYAQGSITGTVRDTSGAVLPGVTVEVASPVLIEKTRTATTDATGQYRLVSLPPGTYAATFTLLGFSTVRQGGIELTGTFSATVNAEMKVGALAETITVSVESPIVDIQSAAQQTVIGKDTITAIPTSGTYNSLLALVPGIVGTSGDVQATPCSCTFSAHGAMMAGRANGEGRILLDGMQISIPQGGLTNYVPNTRNGEDTSFTIAGSLGEVETGGPVISIVPRTGGNNFSGNAFASGVPGWLRGSNFTPELQQAGLPAPLDITAQHDYSGAVGGPILKDRAWFFVTARTFRKNQYVNMYFNSNAGNPNAWLYSPDLSRGQVIQDLTWEDLAGRVTMQITPRNKLNIFHDETKQNRNSQYGSLNIVNTSPEATDPPDQPVVINQATWTSTVSSKVLVEVGAGNYIAHWGGYKTRGVAEGLPGPYTGDLVRMTEQCSAGCAANGNFPGLTYRSQSASTGNNALNTNILYTYRANLTYVTGAQSLKVGYVGTYGGVDNISSLAPNDLIYRVNNGVPNQLTMVITNYPSALYERSDGFYAQERWTRNRLTLSGAVRYDRASSWSPPQQVGPTRFFPTPLAFPRTPGVDAYNDITPRMSAAYDLTGDGKTALKMSLGKYLAPVSTGGAYALNNPTSRIASTVARSWTDANHNFVPDCNLLNPSAQDLRPGGGDFCGAFGNANFGTATFSNTIDPDLLHGWGVRPSDWGLNVSLQREVLPRVSVEAAYVQRWFRGFLVTDNLAVTASDYSPFSVTAPADPRLPNGGGYTIAGLYDVNPSKFGLTNNFITDSSKYGNQYANYHGVDVTVSARLRSSLTIEGGVSGGTGVSDNCAIRARLIEIAPLNPYCHVETPWLPSWKSLASYMIPKGDVQIGVTFMSKPGLSVGAGTGTPVGAGDLAGNYVVPNAAIVPSLGRNLSGNAPNATVNLIQAGTLYGDRINEVDLRASKIVKFGQKRLNLSVDVYNVLNVSPTLSYNQAFIPGGAWLTPLSVMTARFAMLSAQFEF